MENIEKGKNSFSVPQNYFDTLTDEVLLKAREEKIASFAGKRNNYLVPNNYFENLGTQIFEKTTSESKRTKIIPLNTRWMIGVAAAFLIVAAYFFGLNPNLAESGLNEFSQEESIEYIYDNIDDYDIEEIVALLDDDADIDEVLQGINGDFEAALEDINSDNFIDFL